MRTSKKILFVLFVTLMLVARFSLVAFGGCIIGYDPNGGVNEPETVTVNNSVVLPNTPPEYEGHDFLGWSTDENAETAQYTGGQSVPVSGDTVFYAVWKETIHGYKLKYDANGGKGAPEFEYGAGTIQLSTVRPVREGFVFKGWATSASATSAQYQPGASYTLQGSDKTVYAVWASGTESTRYRICYITNGGSHGPEDTWVSGDAMLSKIVPDRLNRIFLGWDTNREGTNAVYQPGDVVHVNADVFLYAVWGTPSTYTATYHSRGGTGSPAVQTGSGAIKLSSVVPTRVGYHFVGWGNSMNATKAYFYPGQDFNLTYNIHFYAVWSADSGYTITYNNKGGSGGPSYQLGIFDITLTDQVPTRSGYTFMGWGSSSGATTAYYFPGGSFYLVRDITLYAVWSSGSGYKLTYDANGGNGAPPEQTGKNTIVLSTKEPYREGYKFLGWGSTQNASKPYYFPGGKFNLTTNTKLYAVWGNSTQYTLTYKAINGSGVPAAQRGIGNIRLSDAVPTRSGYSFAGWGTSQNATTAFYYPGDEFNLTANTTLYAVWKSNTDGYAINYNPRGGSNGPTTQFGKGTVKISNTIPVREGYTFLGWGNSANATVAYYHPGDEVNLTAPITFYAVWEKNVPIDTTDPGTPDAPVNVCRWCGGDHSNGFFQKIIGFFHNILANLFGAKY